MKLFFIGLLLVISASAPLHAETANVMTKQNAIRESCKFFSPVKAAVRYGDALEVVSQEGDWFHVKFRGVQGCIHKSAIQKQSFSLTKLVGAGEGSASGDEVALAGKGFNPQVEAEYKTNNPELNYGAVDRIEGNTVSDGELEDFIQDGKLNLQ